MTRRPDLFIIGAPKSGTTSLYEYLAGHPDVYMSPVKEPGYFAPDVHGVTRKPLIHPDGEPEYLELFAQAHDEKRLGEASTRYILSRAAPGLIRDYQPDARIVAVLRNPVDMIHALHNERVSFGMEPIEDFEQALAADDDRLAGKLLRGEQTPEFAAYRPYARYGEQLGRWFGLFDRARIHVMVFDDFATDTAGEFRRLLGFLEVDPNYAPASFEVRRKSHRRRGGIIGAIIGSRPARWTAHRLLPAVVGANSGASIIWRLRQSRLRRAPHSRSEMLPELRRQLEQEFTPDITRLSELLGRDLVQLWFGRGVA